MYDIDSLYVFFFLSLFLSIYLAATSIATATAAHQVVVFVFVPVYFS
jgi:hypothetical protein